MRVLVLGGGYAGLAFVQGLRRRRLRNLDLTLIDRNPYHTLLTETHAVAAGTLGAVHVEIPFASLGAGVRIVTDKVLSVDAERKVVSTTSRDIPYDYLAFCLGGQDNDFGISGVSEHALFLRGAKDAERIRNRVDNLNSGENVVIVGAGLTGVELAAELAMRHSDTRRVTLIEASPQILPGLPADLRGRARRRLGWLGVNMISNAPVVRLTDQQVLLRDGSALTYGLAIWAAGVKGHPLVGEMDVAVDRNGRAEVDGCLRSSRPDVYVLGDSAAYRPAPDMLALPPSAQLAEQMGFAAAADLANRVRGGACHIFRPNLAGVLFDLGGLNASGLVYRFRIHGLMGALAKRAAVLGHLWRTTGLTGLMIHIVSRVRSMRASEWAQ